MTFETLITFLTIENNNRNIHSDPWIKSDRDSIRNFCDVFVFFSPANYPSEQTRPKLPLQNLIMDLFTLLSTKC